MVMMIQAVILTTQDNDTVMMFTTGFLAGPQVDHLLSNAKYAA